jgi:hypothetical protein
MADWKGRAGRDPVVTSLPSTWAQWSIQHKLLNLLWATSFLTSLCFCSGGLGFKRVGRWGWRWQNLCLQVQGSCLGSVGGQSQGPKTPCQSFAEGAQWTLQASRLPSAHRPHKVLDFGELLPDYSLCFYTRTTVLVQRGDRSWSVLH